MAILSLLSSHSLRNEYIKRADIRLLKFHSPFSPLVFSRSPSITDTDRDSILDARGMDSNSNPTTNQGEVIN